ncbi:Protein tyrosine phosphatase_ receptor type_ C, partial [Caligus rogercresseyi]
YTRLYTKDKYERPFDQEEFLRKASELLREAETSSCPEAQESLLEEGGGNLLISEDSQLAQEFRDLEILAFDTIQRRTRVANSASN